MNSYEILIHNMKDDAEMNIVQNALHEAGITDAGFDEVGPYLQFDKPRSVFVELSDLGAAVKVLNQLGYETDEDDDQDEDDDTYVASYFDN